MKFFSKIEETKLASALVKMKDVNIGCCKLTSSQFEHLFQGMKSETSKIEKLDISFNNVIDIKTSLFVDTVVRLKSLDLTHCETSLDKIKKLFMKLNSEESKIEQINISCKDLSSVDSLVFAEAIVRIKNVELHDSRLTSEQTKQLFKKLCTSSSNRIETLILRENKLNHIDIDTLFNALTTLKTVDVSRCKLYSTGHNLFMKLSEGNGKL